MDLASLGEHVNTGAVLVAALMHFVIGLTWFMPARIGNAWMRPVGDEPQQMSNKATILLSTGAILGGWR